MNKNMLMGVAAILILLGIGGFFILSKKPATNSGVVATTNNGSEQTSPTSADSPKSLKDLFSSGTSQSCSFSVGDSKESSGTVYISNGHMRGDFSVDMQGKVSTTHMIADGTTSYMWVDGQATGFKMAFDPTNAPLPSAAATQSQAVDMQQKMDYHCSSWSPDQNMFTIPTNINFTDMNAMKAGTSVNGSTGADMKVQQCAACNSAPASAQAQCKAAFGCN